MNQLEISNPEKLVVSYEDFGTGIPLFFFPGGGAHIRHYSKFFDRLKDHFRVIAINAPGFETPTFPKMKISVDYYTTYYENVLKNFGFAENLIMGHSLGAGIALNLAQKVPGFIRKEALISPLLTHINCSISELSIRVAKNHFDGKAVAPDVYQNMVKKIQDSLKNQNAIMQQSVMVTTNYSICHNAASKVKKLIFTGQKDVVIPPTQQAHLLKEIPEAEIITYPNSGHDLMFTEIDDVISKTVRFFKDEL